MNIQDRIISILSEERLLVNEPLKNYTSFRVGGSADMLALPTSTEELVDLVKLCRAEGLEFTVLGKGSNVLVSDRGVRGLVIILNDVNATIRLASPAEYIPDYVPDQPGKDYRCIYASAACPLTKVAMDAARAGLTGLEFAAGIPGSLGGAIVMNAGAYGGEIKDSLLFATVLTPEGDLVRMSPEELDLGYRHSCISDRGYIVTDACFKLEESSSIGILARIADLNNKRREKQPLEFPSAGSTFKRPEGYFAGKLIEDAGLKGLSVGDAQVSEKHCGFVINKGQARAKDIEDLIARVQDEVFKQFGVRLEPEIRMIGER